VNERDVFFAVPQRESVQATEVVGDSNRNIDLPVACNTEFADDFLLPVESISTDAATHIRLPY